MKLIWLRLPFVVSAEAVKIFLGCRPNIQEMIYEAPAIATYYSSHCGYNSKQIDQDPYFH